MQTTKVDKDELHCKGASTHLTTVVQLTNKQTCCMKGLPCITSSKCQKHFSPSFLIWSRRQTFFLDAASRNISYPSRADVTSRIPKNASSPFMIPNWNNQWECDHLQTLPKLDNRKWRTCHTTGRCWEDQQIPNCSCCRHQNLQWQRLTACRYRLLWGHWASWIRKAFLFLWKYLF